MEKFHRMGATLVALTVLVTPNISLAKRKSANQSDAVRLLQGLVNYGWIAYPVAANPNGTLAIPRFADDTYGVGRCYSTYGLKRARKGRHEGWDLTPDCVLPKHTHKRECGGRRQMALAMFDGHVTFVQKGPGPANNPGGYRVRIEQPGVYPALGIRYTVTQEVMHCDPNITLRVGDRVRQGQALCKIGDSRENGRHTKSKHLHVMIGVTAKGVGQGGPEFHVDPALLFRFLRKTGAPINFLGMRTEFRLVKR